MEDPHLHQGTEGQGDSTYNNASHQTSVLPYHIRNCVYLTEKLYEMKNENLFCDLVFEIHEQRIYAHRSVVSAWSPYLYNHLKLDLACMEIVRVYYDNYEIFAGMISFMYTGKIDLRDTNLIQLLHLATSFQIETLREVCEGTLRCNLHEGNIVSTFYVARKFKLGRLEEYALSYLQMHLPEAVKQADFLNLTAVRFNTFLSTGWMVHLKPEVKLFLIISWLGYDVKEREQFLVALLQHIDWSTVAGDFLLEISQTDNFFTTNESSLFLLLQTLHSSGIELGSYTEIFPSLREKYCHLLTKVVQNSVLTASPEEYFPVSINVTIALVQANEQFVPHPPVPPTQQNTSDHTRQNDEEPANETSGETSVVTITPLTTQKKTNRKSQKKKESDEMPLATESSPKGHMTTRRKSVIKTMATKIPSDPNDHLVETEHQKEYLNFDNTANSDDADNDYSGYEDDDVRDPDFVNGKDQENETTEPVMKRTSRKKPKKKLFNKASKLPIHQCAECEYTTSSEQRFEEHQLKIHSKSFSCHICTFTCSWNKIFNAHMKKHYYGPPFQCEHDGCKYTADTIRNVLIHRVRHTDERPYPCEECPMKFRTKSNLYAHRKCHQGKKPWKCSVCNMSFATKSTLNQHSVRHSDDRPYLCDKCGFGTKFQSHLISHKRLHTGDVFHCQFPQCSYFAPKKSQLKGHMRSHLGIRKYSCEQCDKSFVEKSHLIRHQKIHLEVKPFSCDFCSYSSTRKDKLKEHVKKRHNTSETSAEKTTKKRKKKSKKDVKVEPQEEKTEEVVAQQPVEQLEQPDTDTQLYPQIVQNTQYINSIDPVIMESVPQNLVIHQADASGLISEGQGHIMSSTLGHQRFHPVGTPIDTQQVTVVMDARIHAQLSSQGLHACMDSTGAIQSLGQPTQGDGGVVYAVPTTAPQTVVMANPQQQDYNTLGSYYSFVMNNEGQ